MNRIATAALRIAILCFAGIALSACVYDGPYRDGYYGRGYYHGYYGRGYYDRDGYYRDRDGYNRDRNGDYDND